MHSGLKKMRLSDFFSFSFFFFSITSDHQAKQTERRKPFSWEHGGGLAGEGEASVIRRTWTSLQLLSSWDYVVEERCGDRYTSEAELRGTACTQEMGWKRKDSPINPLE